MRRLIVQSGLGAFLLSLWVLSPAAWGTNDGQAITPTETIHLFNGKDLSNFYTWLVNHHRQDPDKVFQVVDQVDGAPAIRVSGQHYGGFITENQYKNYHLIVEWKWGNVTWGNRKDRTRDSGILLHCQGRDGNSSKDFNGPWLKSVEFQIIEGGTGDFILVRGYDEKGEIEIPKLTTTITQDRDNEWVWDPKGQVKEFEGGRINWYGRDPDWQDVLGYRGREDVESPVGQWNRLDAFVENGNFTYLVNGRLVNKGRDSNFTQGRILFQSEGAELFFRRVELQPLPPQ